MELKNRQMKLPSGEIIAIWSTADGRAACPVCGVVSPGEWPYVPSTLNSDQVPSAYASHNICPCCSTQYGDTDFIERDENVTQEEKWRRLRRGWLRCITITDDVKVQLGNVGLNADEEIRRSVQE